MITAPRHAWRSQPQNGQGFILIALLTILTMGALYFFISNLTPEAIEAHRQIRTSEALTQAQEALIGYALKYRDDETSKGSRDRMYGYLPLPDMGSSRNNNTDARCKDAGNNPIEGCDANTPTGIACDANNIYPTMIGRFPWRTLGTGPLRDGYGECLWLIVSSLHLRKQCSNPTLPPMNWDTLGQLDIVMASGTNALTSALTSHQRPIAVIFSPGPPLSGQNRGALGGDDVSECGGNYNVANYLDPSIATALGGVTNYLAGTNNASGITGDSDTSNDPDDVQKKQLLLQGKVFKSSANYLPGSCAGAGCELLANDIGLPITSDTMFGALRKSSNFRTDINAMLDRMTACLRDQVQSTGFTPDMTGFAQPGDKYVGRIPTNDPCYGDAVNPLGYFSHYRDQVFVALRNPADFQATVDGVDQTCPAVLIFGGQRGTGQSRSSTTERNTPSNYLEGTNLSSFTTFGQLNFVGPSLLAQVSATQAANQDIVRCVPSGANLTTVESPNLSAAQQLIAYDAASSTLTLGKANVTNSTADSAALFGCAWIADEKTLGSGLRSYFQFSFATLGTSVGNTGFVFALIDTESNTSLPCGSAGSHLGYSGNNGFTPKLRFPKIGIEFDQSRNTGFPGAGGETSTNVGRKDPCYLSSCGAIPAQTASSHAAIAYWGHETANATDAVTLPDGDDNVHGFPTAGSIATVRRPPRNPDTPPGIQFINLRTGGQLFHVRVEITPTRTVDPAAAETSQTILQTKVWILADSATVANQITAMKDTTRPMSVLYPTFVETLSDAAAVFDVAGSACSSGACPTNQTCGTDNICYRQGLRKTRIGFTGSQSTQDQEVRIRDMFTTWLP